LILPDFFVARFVLDDTNARRPAWYGICRKAIRPRSGGLFRILDRIARSSG